MTLIVEISLVLYTLKVLHFKFNPIHCNKGWKYTHNSTRFKVNICKDAHIFSFPTELISSESLYLLSLQYDYSLFADDLLDQNLQWTKNGRFFPPQSSAT